MHNSAKFEPCLNTQVQEFTITVCSLKNVLYKSVLCNK